MEQPRTPVKETPVGEADGPAPHLLHSTSENSPEASNLQSSKIAQCLAASTTATQPTATTLIPRVVIRHRIKGAKKAQRRLRKNEEQNKILLAEFQKHSIWQKSKIVEL